MSIQNRNKLKSLYVDWQTGMVATYPWLISHDISHQLVARYVKSGWLTALGTGAFTKLNDKPSFGGIIYALQKQLKLHIHIGGRSAIELKGYGHYLRFEQKIHLYGSLNTKLPTWFKQCVLKDTSFIYTQTSVFGELDLGMSTIELNGFKLIGASLERAMIEMLALVPKYYGYAEAAHLMEGLRGLRPKVIQQLLEACRSIKAKRLFLHLAESCQHSWLKQINLSPINLGSGVRKLVGATRLDKKYLIYTPDDPLNG